MRSDDEGLTPGLMAGLSHARATTSAVDEHFAALTARAVAAEQERDRQQYRAELANGRHAEAEAKLAAVRELCDELAIDGCASLHDVIAIRRLADVQPAPAVQGSQNSPQNSEPSARVCGNCGAPYPGEHIIMYDPTGQYIQGINNCKPAPTESWDQ